VTERLSSFRMDPASGVGIAAQIRARIALLIADGAIAPGERLPPVRALARQLGVNVNTVRAAYARLKADGLVQTRHGVGSVVLQTSAATALVTGGRMGIDTVGVVIAGLHPFYLPLLMGIEEVAAEQGTLVLIADSRDSEVLAGAMIRRLNARGVDGIIAVSCGGPEDGEAVAAANQLPPIVYVDQPQRTGHLLLFDGRRGGYLATRHLIEHGHERIGVVTPPLSWPNVREVYRGYVDALDGRLDGKSFLSEVSEFSLDAGRLGLAQLLELPEAPTAVFAVDELLALGVLREAQARGIDVPGEIALVGYTDSPVSTLVDPALTMVSVPARESGVRAMRTLQSLIDGRKPSRRRTVLDVELVVRHSCGVHEQRDLRNSPAAKAP
jgi:DNA-binding LacI/PurR family transcriptional regulator